MPGLILNSNAAEAAASELFNISSRLDGLSSELSAGINTIRSARGSEELNINEAGLTDAPNTAKEDIGSLANQIRAKIMEIESFSAGANSAYAANFISKSNSSVNQNSVPKDKIKTKKEEKKDSKDKKSKQPKNLDFNTFSVTQPINQLGNTGKKKKSSKENKQPKNLEFNMYSYNNPKEKSFYEDVTGNKKTEKSFYEDVMKAQSSNDKKTKNKKNTSNNKNKNNQSIAGSNMLVGPGTKIYSDNTKKSEKSPPASSSSNNTIAPSVSSYTAPIASSATSIAQSISTNKSSTKSNQSNKKTTSTKNSKKTSSTKKNTQSTKKQTTKKATNTSKGNNNTKKENISTSVIDKIKPIKKPTTPIKDNINNTVNTTKPSTSVNQPSNTINYENPVPTISDKKQSIITSLNKSYNKGYENGYSNNVIKPSIEIPQGPTEIIKDTVIETPSNTTVGTVGEVIKKGNTYTKIPTSSKQISSSTTSGSSVIPVVAGLGVATVAGIGAKVYLDRKNNNDNTNDYSTDNYESFSDIIADNSNDEIDYDIDYNAGIEKPEYLEDDNYINKNDEQPVEKYDARSSDELIDLL